MERVAYACCVQVVHSGCGEGSSFVVTASRAVAVAVTV